MKDKTKAWLELADSDLQFAESILQNKNRPYYAIHFCHQAIEKLLKAIVQEYTSEDPKRTHNFKTLWEQARIPLSESQMFFLLELMPHYVGTRYPEDIRSLHKTYTVEFVSKKLLETKEIYLWLKKYLTSKKQ
ncbi:MAG: HEPN domain-containing protein [Deltaproteobacteria bacterium]|nr:HEPN domain-containing protein [Deltaproteobacteria bacterium]